MSDRQRIITAQRPFMADYGVPVDDVEGLLDWSWAEQRLASNRNYWVVTVSADGRPHSMPVWGIWMPKASEFWFGAAPSARKLRNISANPQVVFTVDDTVEVVSVEGIARQIDPADPRLPEVIEGFVTKYFDDPNERAEQVEGFAGAQWVQVTPTRAFGVIERPDDFGPTATRWVWSDSTDHTAPAAPADSA